MIRLLYTRWDRVMIGRMQLIDAGTFIDQLKLVVDFFILVELVQLDSVRVLSKSFVLMFPCR